MALTAAASVAPEPFPEPIVVWIASLGARQEHTTGANGVGRRRRKIVDMHRAVRSQLVEQAAQELAMPEANRILGAVRLRKMFRYDHLRLLSPSQREQYRFWLTMASIDLEGNVFFLRSRR